MINAALVALPISEDPQRLVDLFIEVSMGAAATSTSPKWG